MRLIEEIMKEINGVMDRFDEINLDQAMTLITKETPVFVDGEGRSGFVGRCFAMRLMHIGYQPYVMGETITPALKKDQVYLAISGSGTTKNTVSNAKAAKKLGLKISAVTSKEESELGQLADCIIKVPGRIKGDKKTTSIQLLSSLFDQSVHIVLDELCLKLSRRDHVSDEMAAGNHVNVE